MKLTWCTLAAMVACGCGSEPPITPLGNEEPTATATPDRATSPIARPRQAATRPEKTEPTSNVTSAGEPVPGFNLSLVTGFDDRVIAIADMADDADLATVDELADWSLNQRGQVALATDTSTGGFFFRKLALFDGRGSTALIRQRLQGPYDDRNIPHFFGGCSLNDKGAALVALQSRPEVPLEHKLFFVDQEQVRPVPQSQHATNYIASSDGRVAFVLHDDNARAKPDICISDGLATEVCASAHSDPFDPNRQFRNFGQLLGLNARGQLLFEASVGPADSETPHHDRLYLYTPAPLPKGEARGAAAVSRGSFRELARQGAPLPGTDYTVPVERDAWLGASLGERGDVVFSELDFSRGTTGTSALYILRSGSTEWQTLLRAGQHLSESEKAYFMSLPSINGRGQVAFVASVITSPTHAFEERLLRVEADGQFTVLARGGDSLAAGAVLENATAPQLLADGKVVFQAELKRPSAFEFRDSAIVVTDGIRKRLAIRQSELTTVLPGFQLTTLREFRATNSGHIGVFVTGQAFENALLLYTPQFSSRPVRPE